MNRNSFTFELYQESDLESRRDDSALGEGIRAGGLGVAAFRFAELREISIMRFTGVSIQFASLNWEIANEKLTSWANQQSTAKLA